MIFGSIIGDIVGSKYEFHNIKTKDFEFFAQDCFFTDDTVMTISVANALLEYKNGYKDLSNLVINQMKTIGRNYPNCGYGGFFYNWIFSDCSQPYNSFGNGAAMRVAPCGFVAHSLDETKYLSDEVTKVTHSHPEGIKGAQAVACSIFLAREGFTQKEIQTYISNNYYKIDFTLDEIRDGYYFDETCQGTVPQAIECFIESKNFEDAIRNAISIGGDSDTIAAITGGIAEAYYGVPTNMIKKSLSYLDERLMLLVKKIEQL